MKTVKTPAARAAQARRKPRSGATARRTRGQSHRAPSRSGPVRRYLREDGRPREIIVREGKAGNVLVIDRDPLTLGDRRLIAHIGPDEPPENVGLICRLYMDDVGRRACRALVPEDLEGATEDDGGAPTGESQLESQDLSDRLDRSYRLIAHPERRGIAQLRWARIAGGEVEVVSVRDVVGALESYEPARTRSLAAIAGRAGSGISGSGISVSTLRAELARLDASPIVLNRRLREVVTSVTATGALSMSEIAQRCGRVKRDARGRQSGEASWLGRRIGLLAEAGSEHPTPWVHSDVLALIARRGLAISPREVEL